MIGSALERAMARGLMVRAPTAAPNLAELRASARLEAMTEWLIANTIEPERFDIDLVEAVLAEAFPQASPFEVRCAAASIDLSWATQGANQWSLKEKRVARRPSLAHPRLETLPAGRPAAPAAAFGKSAGLGFTLVLAVLLGVAVAWAV